MRSARFLRAMVLVAAATALAGAAAAADSRDMMLGKWRWQDFVIEVVECRTGELCAKVIAGPRNVGLDVFAAGLIERGGNWLGQIVHPETKETYNTRFQPKGKDRWRLDGCTATRVCLSGELVRTR